jgi:hypothetical protein
VRLETKGLANDSTLVWESPADGRAVRYGVLWRATAAPGWEHSYTQDVANRRSAVMPVSKDNVIFAVQAVDEAGHRSLPIVPIPER